MVWVLLILDVCIVIGLQLAFWLGVFLIIRPVWGGFCLV